MAYGAKSRKKSNKSKGTKKKSNVMSKFKAC